MALCSTARLRTVSTPSDIFEYAHRDAKTTLLHVATEDIYSDGFLIPAGSCITGNVSQPECLLCTRQEVGTPVS
jgi:hypothetical protein